MKTGEEWKYNVCKKIVQLTKVVYKFHNQIQNYDYRIQELQKQHQQEIDSYRKKSQKMIESYKLKMEKEKLEFETNLRKEYEEKYQQFIKTTNENQQSLETGYTIKLESLEHDIQSLNNKISELSELYQTSLTESQNTFSETLKDLQAKFNKNSKKVKKLQVIIKNQNEEILRLQNQIKIDHLAYESKNTPSKEDNIRINSNNKQKLNHKTGFPLRILENDSNHKDSKSYRKFSIIQPNISGLTPILDCFSDYDMNNFHSSLNLIQMRKS